MTKGDDNCPKCGKQQYKILPMRLPGLAPPRDDRCECWRQKLS